jgi:hypothetical protein
MLASMVVEAVSLTNEEGDDPGRELLQLILPLTGAQQQLPVKVRLCCVIVIRMVRPHAF